jgi:hypothetical protein
LCGIAGLRRYGRQWRQCAGNGHEREIAQFVDDDEIVAQQVLGETAAATSSLLLLELVDQIDQVEEASSGAGADNGRGDAYA